MGCEINGHFQNVISHTFIQEFGYNVLFFITFFGRMWGWGSDKRPIGMIGPILLLYSDWCEK